jgi:uncharacterized protein YndB with AHSA1/START domain
MTYDFKLSCTLPASPEAVYDAWLDSAEHSAMTGAGAKINNRVGGAYSAWDGYITGKTVELRLSASCRVGGRPNSATITQIRRSSSNSRPPRPAPG